MRFALVGCGVIAPTHVRALLELAGRARARRVLRRRPGARRGVRRRVRSPRRAVRRGPRRPRRIDAVTVCTPSGLHAEVGVPALLAGKHVVVEKPHGGQRSRRATALLAAAGDVGRDARGDLPAPLRRRLAGGQGRGRRRRPRPPRARPRPGSPGTARRTTTTPATGAAPGRSTAAARSMNQGVHTLDLLRWTCGPVETVYAQARTAAHERIEVEDVVCATVEFAGGAIGTVMASTAAYPGFPARLGVHGTRGGAVIEGDRLATFATVDGVLAGGGVCERPCSPGRDRRHPRRDEGRRRVRARRHGRARRRRHRRRDHRAGRHVGTGPPRAAARLHRGGRAGPPAPGRRRRGTQRRRARAGDLRVRPHRRPGHAVARSPATPHTAARHRAAASPHQPTQTSLDEEKDPPWHRSASRPAPSRPRSPSSAPTRPSSGSPTSATARSRSPRSR